MIRVLRMPGAAPPASAPLVAFAGGGFFVTWMMGVAHEMRACGVPLHRCVFSGASAGASIAAFLACGVDCRAVLDYILADEARGTRGLGKLNARTIDAPADAPFRRSSPRASVRL